MAGLYKIKLCYCKLKIMQQLHDLIHLYIYVYIYIYIYIFINVRINIFMCRKNLKNKFLHSIKLKKLIFYIEIIKLSTILIINIRL